MVTSYQKHNTKGLTASRKYQESKSIIPNLKKKKKSTTKIITEISDLSMFKSFGTPSFSSFIEM